MVYYLTYLTYLTFDMRYYKTNTDQGHNIREHLLKTPGIHSQVTPPNTNRAQRCLTLVIRWVPVCTGYTTSRGTLL
jgi:hypothetical protein